MKNPASILARSKSSKSKLSRDTVEIAAAELGRQGGYKGGPARAEALSSEDRRTIAIHAVLTRWGRECGCKYCK